jgi:hypothetical protein
LEGVWWVVLVAYGGSGDVVVEGRDTGVDVSRVVAAFSPETTCSSMRRIVVSTLRSRMERAATVLRPRRPGLLKGNSGFWSGELSLEGDWALLGVGTGSVWSALCLNSPSLLLRWTLPRRCMSGLDGRP